MTVYQTIEKTVQRSALSSRTLHLGFDLRDEFCSAAWEALDAPVKTALVCQNQTRPLATIADRHVLDVTKSLHEFFHGVVSNAIFAEARRIGTSFPDELTNNNNMDCLIAACIEHDHATLPKFNKSYDPRYNQP